MLVDGKPQRTIWLEDGGAVGILDQTRLPHEFVTLAIDDWRELANAIRTMQVRGAPLIGVTAAHAVALAMRDDASDEMLERACRSIASARPTAVNLAWAVNAMRAELAPLGPSARARHAHERARAMAEADVECCRRIGEHGFTLLEAVARRKGRVNVLTHCNAGWLATVDWGTALAPIFLAHRRGLDVHVFVDETRPRSQGMLTAWELAQEGVRHTLVVDNAGGHLMQHGMVDLCLVGTDRTTRRGDVCNKIGTYLKALCAKDNGVPFYAAVPASSIDFALDDGVLEIPIEERDEREVHELTGRTRDGRIETVRVSPDGTRAANYGFDVTPARLVTGLVTDRGVCEASAAGLAKLFPENR